MAMRRSRGVAEGTGKKSTAKLPAHTQAARAVKLKRPMIGASQFVQIRTGKGMLSGTLHGVFWKVLAPGGAGSRSGGTGGSRRAAGSTVAAEPRRARPHG